MWAALTPPGRLEPLRRQLPKFSRAQVEVLSRLEYEAMVNDTSLHVIEHHSISRLSEIMPGIASLTTPPDLLQLSTRARNSLRSIQAAEWSALGDLSASAIQGMRSVGLLTTIEILDWIVDSVMSAEPLDEVPEIPPASAEDEAAQLQAIAERELEAALIDAIRLLVAWCSVVSPTDPTVGEAIELAKSEGGGLPDEVAEAMRTIQTSELTSAVSATSAKDVRRHLADDRLWIVLRFRFLNRGAGTQETLQQVGDRIGVSRERVRQLEAHATDRVRAVLRDPEFAGLRWQSERIRNQLGAGVPLVSDLAAEHLGRGSKTELLKLWAAGPYEVHDGWLRRVDADPAKDLEAEIRRVASPTISASQLARAAAEVGVPEAAAVEAAELVLTLRRLGDDWVLWDGSQSERALIILELLGRPADLDEIVEHLDQDVGRRSFANRLLADERFCRVSKNKWALTAWDLEPYAGIAEELAKGIEAGGGSAHRAELISSICSRFQVSESSVNTYANAPRFVTEGATIRLRMSDEPVPLPARRSFPNVFTPAPGVVHWRLHVDSDWLRGSGRNVGTGLASALGSAPGTNAEYSTTEQVIEVFWSLSDISPHVGSLRRLLKSLGTSDGDSVVIRFDTYEHRASASLVHPDTTGLDLLRQVAGIAGDEPWRELADALDVEIGQVREALERRHSGDLVPHLPLQRAHSEATAMTAGDDTPDAASLVADLTGDLRPF